jgi:pilus assembly protein FimV
LVSLALLLFFSPVVFGLGLGNVKIESFLNQPLNARIDLLVRPGEDISGVTARLASAEDYALIGASRDAISVPLRFTVDTQSEQPFIRVTSTLPVNQPVVRLIVELNWASGRLLREYTLFLDPPVVPASAPPPVVDERRAAPAPAEIETAESIPSNPDEPGTAAETASDSQMSDANPEAPATQFSDGSEYGPVQSGDTLWKIASNWSAGTTASVNSTVNPTVNQIMVAIQRNNPQAFINNNINLLKRGAILRMPDSNEIFELSAAEATAAVRDQAEMFSGGTAAPSTTSVAAPAVETPLVDVASDISSSGPNEAYVDDSPKLEIVPPSAESAADSAYGDEDSPEGSAASTSLVDLQEELARKEEALITEQQTNEYLQQRIRELESQVADPSGPDLVVEDEQLAEMESRLQENRQEAAPVQAIPPEPETPWYKRGITWLIVALVMLVSAGGWFFSRRNNATLDLQSAGEDASTVRGIKDEAEEILKVLKPAGAGSVEGKDDSTEGDPAEPAATKPQEPQEAIEDNVVTAKFNQARHLDHEEAYVLDEDSADPEVRLDLARAYISMGDREAARAILGEVIEHGDDGQKAEAQSMLDAM